MAFHFDELRPGQRIEAGPRVISRADIDSFSELSGDHTALHTDEAFAAASPLGGLVAHGALNLSVATGLAYASGAFDGTVLAFRELRARFDRPVFPGDQVALEPEVTGLDERPRPESGKVQLAMRLVNQAGKRVLSGEWTLVLARQQPGRADSSPSPETT